MASAKKDKPARVHPLEDQIFAGNSVLLKPETAKTRISLRAHHDQINAVNDALNIKLPTKPKSTHTNGKRTAMWLGPDEWLILDKPGSDLKLAFQTLSNIECSAVDVSHRNTAISLTGAKAADIINAGCPQNLAMPVFGVDACSRTVLGKSEIILWRTGQNEFHIECWRSFSDYVWKFLVDAAKTA